MTISITTTDAGTSTQPITQITKDEFILQGYDIVQAYAKNYRVTALRPYDGAGQLADFMWKRFADANGTIPLLQEHTAVRLSDGHLRVMARISDSEGSATHSMPGPTVDDFHPPIEPPELDEDYVLPNPFHRLEEPRATRQIIPFPSAPEDACSPRDLVFTDTEPLEISSVLDITPKLDPVYPLPGQLIIEPTGEQIGHENPPVKWITRMVERARHRRQKLWLLFGDAKAKLASAVLELQQVRNELDVSVVESQKTMNQLRNVFGTECALEVMNAKEEMRKKHEKSPVEDMRRSASSFCDYNNDNAESDSRPETWSSRDSPSTNDRGIIDHDTIRPNVIDQSKRTSGYDEIAEIPEIAEIETMSAHGGSSMEGVSSFSPRSLSSSNAALGKRAREEEEIDSETEVEASVLYNDEPLEEYPKKVRLDQAGTSVRVTPSRRSCLKRSRDMDVDSSSSRPAHRVRFPENPASSSNRSSHGQINSKSPPLRPKSTRKTSTPTGRRRPLVRSTSHIMETEDGGYYYLKYFPPNSKETSH